MTDNVRVVACRILVIDNYDSFVFNIVQYLRELGARVDVVPRDNFNIRDLSHYSGVLISPGPGTPEQAQTCVDVVEKLHGKVPILGVCLGHQVIGVAFGAAVRQAPELYHGRTSQIWHSKTGVFEGLPIPFTATRYHSLTIDRATLPDELEISAHTDSHIVMAIKHREHPVEGVQFHPESILTDHGHALLGNWLTQCGESSARERAQEIAAQGKAVKKSTNRLGWRDVGGG